MGDWFYKIYMAIVKLGQGGLAAMISGLKNVLTGDCITGGTSSSGAPPYSDTKSTLFDRTLPAKVDFGQATSFQFAASDPFSVSFWIKVTDFTVSTFEDALGNFQGADASGWGIYTRVLAGPFNTMQFSRLGGAGHTLDVFLNTASLSSGTWYHIVFTSNGPLGTDVKGYVNAVSQALANPSNSFVTANYTTGHFKIGQFNGSTNNLGAKVDEVSIWSKVLSAADVTALYNAGHPPDITGSANLLSWWRMGDLTDSTTTIVDRVGTVNGTGTNISFTTDVPP